MKLLFTFLLTLFSCLCHSQKLSIDDLKKIDTLGSKSLKTFLVSKGYKLMQTTGSESAEEIHSVYGYQVKTNDLLKAELEGERIVRISEIKLGGKWDIWFTYITPDETEVKEFDKSCTESGLKETWAPFLEEGEGKYYELESNNKFIIASWSKNNTLPKRKSCYQLTYSSTKIED